MRGGFVGVDVFFVISGFLISSILFSQLENGSFSFWHFYSRRIRRIYPVLITVLFACLAIGWIFLTNINQDYYLFHSEYAQLGKHVAGGAGFISNFLLWFESGYFDGASELKPLLHLWSLGIEEQFYIVWPLLLWFAWKKRLNLFWVSAALAATSFFLNLYFYRSDPAADFFSPYTRFWELLCGAMLAWFMSHRNSPLFSLKTVSLQHTPFFDLFHKYGYLRHIFSVSGALLIVISVFFVKNTSTRGYPGPWALFPVLAAVLLIVAGKDGWFNRHVLSNRVLVWFGLISYPLYLWHWPLLSMARIVLRNEPPLWIRVAAFPVCILLAWLTTKFIENPLRFGQSSNFKTVALFSIMLCLGASGMLIFQNKGSLSTPPPIIQTLENVVQNDHKTNPAFSNGCHQNIYNKYKECPHWTSHSTKPTIAVWGDSHAAHLVAGFEKNFGDQFNILQRTGGSCPAILTELKTTVSLRLNIPSCLEKNGLILKEIIKVQPDYVILAGSWSSYFESYKNIGITVEKLKKNGIQNIAIIGPVPIWKMKLPMELIRIYQKNTVLPDRIRANEEKFVVVDKTLSELSEAWKVHYISPVKLLCNEVGCKTRAGDESDSVLSFDQGHLTEAGSDFLVSQFRNDPFFGTRNELSDHKISSMPNRR